MVLHIKNPKVSTKNLLEIINEYNKVARYKIVIQKFIMFLHTHNELADRETKKKIPFTITSE